MNTNELAIVPPAETALPVVKAGFDWAVLGAFMPEQFRGEQRRQYEAEAARIEQQWDNQPR